MENTSGQKRHAVVPDEIKRWNWGAFLLTWVWGARNKVYIAFLCFIPYAGIIMAVILGVKGSEWAWRNKRWNDIEHFKRVQKRWERWGIGMLLVFILLGILVAIVIPLILDNRSPVPVTA